MENLGSIGHQELFADNPCRAGSLWNLPLDHRSSEGADRAGKSQQALNPERLLQAFCGRWRFTFQPAIAQVSASLTRYLKVFDLKVP